MSDRRDQGPGPRAGRGRSGFTLVEVVVALLLLSVGVLAMGEILRLSAEEAAEADHRERLLWWATGVADSLATAPVGGSGSTLLPGGAALSWAVGAGGGWVEARLPGADSAWVRLPVIPLGAGVPLSGEGS